MLGFTIRRMAYVVVVVFSALVFVFTISHAVPGDPARTAMGQFATEEAVEKYRREYGLHRPLLVQFLTYLQHLARGDMGRSVLTTRPVVEELGGGLPATFELVIPALAFATLVGLYLGMISATAPNVLIDQVARTVSLFGMAMPVFWLALVLQLIFFRWLDLLPIGQRISQGFLPPPTVTGLYTIDSVIARDWGLFADALKHLVLPVFTLSLGPLAVISRMMRATVLETIRADYIRTAYSKGVSKRIVLLRHALPNALIPTLTIIGLSFGSLLGGAVIVETIFAWPGIGRRAYQALIGLDYPMVMGFTIWLVVAYSLVNLLVDLTYPLIDPRIRYDTGEA